uniref:Large ribosomal subunit protein uL30m n=1 Tax=Sphenodon punctatus TaxID=8508 RepID=A0A8D0HGQ7_SPHPU
MALFLGRRSAAWQTLAKSNLQSLTWTGWIRHSFTKSRISESVFQPRPEDHEKYGGDPLQPHKLHLVTRIRSGIGRPYWENKIIQDLGLEKAHQFRHLVRIRPLKLPHGIPTEEDMSDTFINSKGELIIWRRLKPVEEKAIELS